jgi:hypothetical protein
MIKILMILLMTIRTNAILSILLLILSGPVALFGSRIWITSIISFSVICISWIILFVFESSCGRVTFCSSSFDIELNYLKSLQQSKYPSNWKSAHVIAIFKKGDTSLPSNYHPISLISCVGKLMERIVYKHVYNHLFILWIRPLCQTLSKALEKSQKTKQLNSFFSREFRIILYSSNSGMFVRKLFVQKKTKSN